MSLHHQSKGLRRDTTLDKFYTKPEVVASCIEHIKTYLRITDRDIIIEPSAGNGSFIPGIQSLCKNILCIDIHPDNPTVTQGDFLQFDASSLVSRYDTLHVVGNPPFGRQASLAIKFIKKASEYCTSISFILPKSFKKDSMQKHFPVYFHLIFEENVSDNAFRVNDADHDVPCVFQIWEKRTQERIPVLKLVPNGFTFTKKTESPDISFRRVGVNAGVVDTVIDTKSEQSHYFIRFQNREKLHDTIQKVSSIVYTFDNTVGPKSIGKQEVIKEFNAIIR